ncbi:hypothetical protein [Brachybacterium timonense]|nr:hypothetical protein [Brachybacterium timonense]
MALIEKAMGKRVIRDWNIDSEFTDSPENFNDEPEVEEALAAE